MAVLSRSLTSLAAILERATYLVATAQSARAGAAVRLACQLAEIALHLSTALYLIAAVVEHLSKLLQQQIAISAPVEALIVEIQYRSRNANGSANNMLALNVVRKQATTP